MGLIFGAALAIASKIFAVDTDDRLNAITDALPGANCGGCGCASCAQFAQAVLDNKAGVDGCPVGGEKVSAAIAGILGIEPPNPRGRVCASVFCSAKLSEDKFDYNGIADCRAAAKLGGGSKSCPYACLGMGSCVSECMFDAIQIVDGVAVIINEKCTACGRCIKRCPKNIIALAPFNKARRILCLSKDKGPAVKSICETGCIACGICVKKCPAGAIAIENNLARIDYGKCTDCGECVNACPRKTIRTF